MPAQNIWTLLLTYSLIQGYLIAIYVLIKLKKQFLSGLLFVISTLILAYLYERFSWYLDFPQFIWAAAPLWYLAGPLILFFIRKQFQSKISIWEFIIHLIPFSIFLIYISPFYFWSNDEKIKKFEEVFSAETYTGDLNHYFFSLHLTIYIFISFVLLKKLIKKRKLISAETTIVFYEFIRKLLVFYGGYSILALLFYLLLDMFYLQISVFHPVNYLLLSMVIHLTTYYSLLKRENVSELSSPGQSKKYSSSSLKKSEMKVIIKALLPHISQIEVFSNPNLRLRDVADDLELSTYQISQSMNQELKKSFFDIVNEKRVNAVKENLMNPVYSNYTLAAIAQEFGFKSASSFYRIFKQHTGKTPREYIKILNNPGLEGKVR